jgi:hypothetical protein
MTIDERLEALAQSVELLQLSQRDTDERIRHLAVIAEQNEVRAGHMMEAIGRLDVRAGEMMDAIKRLARITDIHDRRIERLES